MGEDVRDKIRNAIAAAGELEGEKVDDQSDLLKDLNFESIKIIQLMVALEEEFGIEFDDMESFVEAFGRVDDFIRYVEAQVAKGKEGKVDG